MRESCSPVTAKLNDAIALAMAVMLSFLLTACGGGGSDSGTSTALIDNRPVSQSDTEIAQLLYTDSRRTPADFFQDTTQSINYVATSHIKNTDLVPNPGGAQFEMCTDDWTTALSWSDQIATGAQASTLFETNTTTQYYEFGRMRSGTPPVYVRARVYRCNYLDRSSVDLRSSGASAGVLNRRPITASELQQLSEYLWQFTTFNNYGHAVLKSSGTTSASALQHSLIIASLTASATINGCDRIDVSTWTHTVDTQTGALQLTSSLLWQFGARRNVGLIELCQPN